MYSMILNNLLRYVFLRGDWANAREIIAISDILPKSVEKAAFQNTLFGLLPGGVKGRILHHVSYSHYGLQLVDYCSWAIFRKWEREDKKYYDLIQPALQSEFDFFRRGKTIFY